MYANMSKDIQRTTEGRPVYNRVALKDGSNLGIIISQGTTILMPILTSIAWKGGLHDGKILEDENDIRYAARKDTDESREIWALWKKVQPRSGGKADIPTGVDTLGTADEILALRNEMERMGTYC